MKKTIQLQLAGLTVTGFVLLGIFTVTAQEAAPTADEAQPADWNELVAPEPEPEPAAELLPEEAVEPEPAPTANALPPVEVVEVVPVPETPDTKATVSDEDENLINITLRDVELIAVVEMFTTLSGANILSVPTNLTGRVTVNLSNVEWKPALESILDMHNLQLRETMPGIEVYSIVAKDPEAPEPMEVETLFLDYAKVSDVYPVVKSMMRAGGTLSPFPSRNAMVIRSTRGNLADIRKLVTSIDTFRDQVFIEAKFMELDDAAIKDLGINWQVLQGYSMGVGGMTWRVNQQREWGRTREDGLTRWDERGNQDQTTQLYDLYGTPYQEESREWTESPPGSGVYTAQDRITPTREMIDRTELGQDYRSVAGDTFTRTSTDMRSAILSADDFRLTLSALQQVNGVSVVSNPKIIVANEESAVIHIGQTERPFDAEIIPATERTDARVVYRPGAPVDLGVKLTVTPTVNTMSNITVRISPELTRLAGYDIAPDGRTRYPIVSTKTIQTMFCLESGKTVAIGGLTETEDREETKKVPLLGDIPIIGKYLFSHQRTVRSQKETIIFVTVGLAMPDTMDPSDGLPQNTDLTHREMMRSDLIRMQREQERVKLQTALDSDDRRARNRALRRR